MHVPDNLVENRDLRNKSAVFRDRYHAGEIVAEILAPDYKDLNKGLVLAIPSGGVPVGISLHKHLGLPLDLIIIRKIQIPGNTEAGFGALSQTGETFLNRELIYRLGLGQEEVEAQIEKTRQELTSKDERFRRGRAFPDLKGKRIILTDDGLASGFSMLAALRMIRSHQPAQTVVAVPTAPLSSVQMLASEADRIYSAHVQESGPFAVAGAYQDWYDLSDSDVLEWLEQARIFRS